MVRRVLEIGLAALLLLAIAGVGTWIYRVDLAGWAVTRLLERHGFGPASFTIDTVDLRGLRAHDLSLRGGAIKAGDLTVSFSPVELLSNHLGAVEIGGFDLTLAVTKDGLQMAGKPLAIGGSGSSAAGGLHIDALTLREAHLLLDTADGPIEARVSTVLTPSSGNFQSSAFSATITAPVGGARHTASITVQKLGIELPAAGGTQVTIQDAAITVDGSAVAAQGGAGRKVNIAVQKLGVELPAAGGVQLTLQDGSIAVDGLFWAAKGAAGQIAWQDGKTTAQLTVGQLTNSQKPMLVTPLGLGIAATLSGNRLDFSLQAKSIGKSPQTMQAKGQYDLASQIGTANINVAPIAFHRGGLQPGDLFPAFGNPVDGLEGTLALAGVLRWKAKKLAPDLVLTLKQLAFATSTAQVQALNGAIRITGLSPLATAAGQILTATIVTAGLPPTDLTLKGQLDPKPILKLDRLAFNFAGGQITAAPFAIDPVAPAFGTTLQVDGVDLAEITKLLSLDGLSGTGQLDGPIPFVLKNGKIEITGGHLTARKPGVLSYRPSKLPDALASAGGSVALALQALSDFRYDKLALGLDKSATGEGTVLLQLDGQNPAVLSGQAFHFNIRVDSNFDRLADIALTSLRSAQELLRRATRRATP